jgi:dTDP-4-dehydrorhamnose reductase
LAPYDSILITGGRGMLAQAFARVLGERGRSVTLASRAECDIADGGQVGSLFARARPTLVLNCAAYTKVDLAEKEPEQARLANSVAPGVLAAECRRRGTALVHFSTDYVFDGTIRRPLRPEDPVGPRSAYGKSKLEGERAIQAIAPPRWMIVRTAWLYGPGGPNFVQTMLNVARAGKPLRVVNDQVGSPTCTFDLARATLDLLDGSASGVWHVSNSGETTWFDFAKAIFDEWGLSPDLQPTTSARWKVTKPDSAVRPAYSVFDLAPLANLLGRTMRPWRDALREYHTTSAAAEG